MPSASDLARIKELVEAGRVTPEIDRVLTFDEIREALAYSERGRARDKIVLKM